MKEYIYKATRYITVTAEDGDDAEEKAWDELIAGGSTDFDLVLDEENELEEEDED